MIITIPMEKEDIQSEVCPSFGRAPYFMTYDTETNEAIFIVNDAASAEGGAGIKAAQQVVDLGTHVLITPRLGKNAADIMLAGDIQLRKSNLVNAYENIELQLSNSLTALTEIHAGFHGHGDM